MVEPVNTDPKQTANWGNCARPNCYYQSSRCATNYCSKCCLLDHEFEHTKPWASSPNLYSNWPPKIAPNGAHSVMCTCSGCMHTARAKAAEQRHADADKLPTAYEIANPVPVVPKLGEMTERTEDDALDWPLENQYTKAKTAWYGE